MHIWGWARDEVGLLACKTVRVEVLTREELDRQCEADNDDLEQSSARELITRALHDSLTGLPGAGLFTSHLEEELERAGHEVAGGGRVPGLAVMRLDLDDVGLANLRWGGLAVDRILGVVAARIAAIVGRRGGVGRLGEDQFGLFVRLDQLVNGSVDDLATQILRSVRRPIRHLDPVMGDVVMEVSASLGSVVTGPAATKADDLLAKAAIALVTAKTAGKDRHVSYRPALSVMGTDSVESEEARVPELGSLLSLVEGAASVASVCRSFDCAARQLIRQACICLGWPLGVATVTGGNGVLSYTSEWHSDDRVDHLAACVAGGACSLSVATRTEAVESARPAWRVDIGSDPGEAGVEAARSAGIRSVLVLPICVGARVVAALEFFIRPANPPTPALLATLQTVAAQLARVAERAEFESAGSQVDPSRTGCAHVPCGCRLPGPGDDLSAGLGTYADSSRHGDRSR